MCCGSFGAGEQKCLSFVNAARTQLSCRHTHQLAATLLVFSTIDKRLSVFSQVQQEIGDQIVMWWEHRKRDRRNDWCTDPSHSSEAFPPLNIQLTPNTSVHSHERGLVRLERFGKRCGREKATLYVIEVMEVMRTHVEMCGRRGPYATSIHHSAQATTTPTIPVPGIKLPFRTAR